MAFYPSVLRQSGTGPAEKSLHGCSGALGREVGERSPGVRDVLPRMQATVADQW